MKRATGEAQTAHPSTGTEQQDTGWSQLETSTRHELRALVECYGWEAARVTLLSGADGVGGATAFVADADDGKDAEEDPSAASSHIALWPEGWRAAGRPALVVTVSASSLSSAPAAAVQARIERRVSGLGTSPSTVAPAHSLPSGAAEAAEREWRSVVRQAGSPRTLTGLAMAWRLVGAGPQTQSTSS